MPGRYAVQVPAAPRTAHERHAPVQVPSQQTPSTQKPEAHSLGAAHGMPTGRFRAQKPLRQKAPFPQSASPLHGWGQSSSEPLHASGEQLGEPGNPDATGRQVPAVPLPSQRSHAPAQGALQQTPSVQKPEAHSPPEAHAVPAVFSGTHEALLQ
jgi:hypothetical protein